MKKTIYKRILCLLLVVVSFALVLLFSGCNKKDKLIITQFGEFGYHGKYLISFAQREVSSSDAQEILYHHNNNIITKNSKKLQIREPLSSSISELPPAPSSDLIDGVISNYSECITLTKYYEEGAEEQLTKEDKFVGTELKMLLTKNEFVPYAQLVAKYILISPDIIAWMEAQNDIFRQSEEAKVYPFQNIYSYHTDENGNVVIHIRDFSEIPSSVTGGIATSHRQDTEILFDNQGKIRKWQTSLGLNYSTPTGIIKQGYILEIEFVWEGKV